jgi:hypothetical protein
MATTAKRDRKMNTAGAAKKPALDTRAGTQLPARNVPRSKVIECVMLIVRPLVRLLIAHGISFTEIAEHLKRLYVEVANDHFTIEGKRQTDSRIALVTGVHRKDVKRFREEDSGLREEKQGFSPTAMILSRWAGESRFMTKGSARPLLRRRDALAHPDKSVARLATFEDLIESVSKDIPVRAVLDEWLRVGVVTINDANEIEMDLRWSSTAGEHESFLSLTAVHGYDRLTAAMENYLSSSVRHPIKSVDIRGITHQDVEMFAEMFDRHSAKFIDTFNGRMTTTQEKRGKSSEANMRVGLGLYYYSEPLDAPGSRIIIT